MTSARAAIDAAAWRRYRIGRRILVGGLVLYLPVVAGVSLLLARAIDANVAPVVAGSWMLAWCISVAWHRRLRCPACARPFFRWNIWTTRCAHCKATPAE